VIAFTSFLIGLLFGVGLILGLTRRLR